MAEYRFEYRYTMAFGSPRHTWTAIGAKGGLHVHITDYGEEYSRKHSTPRYGAGIEIHWRHPPGYMKDQPPSQDECWLLKCSCWHDGSSLQGSEIWVPAWEAAPHDHDKMFRALEIEADERFGEEKEEPVDAMDAMGCCKPKTDELPEVTQRRMRGVETPE